jgi:hypothetical protein
LPMLTPRYKEKAIFSVMCTLYLHDYFYHYGIMHSTPSIGSNNPSPMLEFKNNLWGLGTELELGSRTCLPEVVFLNF